MRYKLRTLLILLAVLPPLLAVGWWKYSAWRAEQERQRVLLDPYDQREITIQPGNTFAVLVCGPDGKEVVEVWHLQK